MTHPDQLDRGIPTRDRLWPLNTLQAHIAPGLRMIQQTNVLMIALPVSQTGKLTSFDSFPRSSARASCYEAALQIVIRAHARARRTYFAKAKGAVQDAFPLTMFLEVVGESPEAQQARKSTTDYVDEEGNAFPSMRAEIQSDVIGVDAAQRTRLADAQSGVVDKTLTPFMSELGGSDIAEYRIWLMNSDPALDYSESFYFELKLGFEMHLKRVGGDTLEIDDRDLKKQKAGLMAGGESRSSALKASSVVSDTERWAMWSTLEMWFEYVSIYTGDDAFRDPVVIARCLSATKDLAHPENPASPHNVFAAPAYFMRAHPELNATQITFSNYYEQRPSGESVWKFPFPSCVIQVPTQKIEVGAFCCLYTPDHQARNVQPRLSRKDFPPYSLVVAATATTVTPRLSPAASGAASNSTTPPPRRLPRTTTNNNNDDDDNDDNTPMIDADAQRINGVEVDTDDEGDYTGDLVNELGDLSLDGAPADVLRQAQSDLLATAAASLGINLQRLSAFSSSTNNVLPPGRVLSDTQRMSGYDFGDPSTRKQARAISEMANGAGSSSGTDAMMQHYKKTRGAERRRIKDDVERSITYTIIQDAGFADYEATCMSSSSTSISNVGKIIMRWRETQEASGTLCFATTPVVVDPKLSTFGAMVSGMLLDYNNVGAIFAAHREMLTIDMASFDTFRHQYTLHICVGLFGEAAVSKSYVIINQHDRSIPGTTRMLNGMTAAANNIEGERDDEFTLYQEMDRSLLAESDGKAPDKNKQHDQFKERLGTCYVTTVTFHLMPDGTRTQRYCRSSQIGGCVFASNMDCSAVAQPILSRIWVLRMLLMTKCGGRDMAEADAAARAAAESDRMIIAHGALVHNHRMFQMLHYLTEKLIYTGLLAEVSLPLFNLYMPIFRKILDTEFGITVHVRTVNRLEAFTRKLVVNEALYRAFCQSTSPFYGKQFKLHMLKWIDPWLKDHQELVFFVIAFSMDSCIDPHEMIINEELTTLFPVATFADRNYMFETAEYRAALAIDRKQHQDHQEGGKVDKFDKPRKADDFVHSGVHARPSAQSRADADAAEVASLAAQFAAATSAAAGAAQHTLGSRQSPPSSSTTTPPVSTPVRRTPAGNLVVPADKLGNYDWDYTSFQGTLAQLAMKIAGKTKRRERPLSIKQSLDSLQVLTGRTVQTKRYKQNVNFGRTGPGMLDTDVYPVIIDQEDGEEDRRIPAIRVVSDHGRHMVFIASALVFAKHRNPIKTVLERLNCHRTPERRVVSGEVFKPDAPYLFAAASMRPNRARVHTVTNHSTLDINALKWTLGGNFYKDAVIAHRMETRHGRKMPPWYSQAGFVVACAPDDYATMRRLADIDLPYDNSVLIRRYSPPAADEYMRSISDRVDDDQLATYPEDTYKDLNRTESATRLQRLIERTGSSRLHAEPALRDSLIAVNHREPVQEAQRTKKRDAALYARTADEEEQRRAKSARIESELESAAAAMAASVAEDLAAATAAAHQQQANSSMPVDMESLFDDGTLSRMPMLEPVNAGNASKEAAEAAEAREIAADYFAT